MKTLPKQSSRGPATKKARKTLPNAETKPVLSGDRAPRLPHEHDESASSQDSGPREVIEQAYRDVQNGLVDSDRGPAMDALYKRTLRSNKP